MALSSSSPLTMMSPRKGILKRPKDPSQAEGDSEADNKELITRDDPHPSATMNDERQKKKVKRSTVSWKDIVDTSNVDTDAELDRHVLVSKRGNDFDSRNKRCNEKEDSLKSIEGVASVREGTVSNDDTTAPTLSSVSAPMSRSKSTSRASSSSWRRAIEARLYGNGGSQIGEGIPLQPSSPIRSHSRRRPPSPHPVVLGENLESPDNTTSSSGADSGKSSHSSEKKGQRSSRDDEQDAEPDFRKRRISLSPRPPSENGDIAEPGSKTTSVVSTETFARRRVARTEYLLSQTGGNRVLTRETRVSLDDDKVAMESTRPPPPPPPTRIASHCSLGSNNSSKTLEKMNEKQLRSSRKPTEAENLKSQTHEPARELGEYNSDYERRSMRSAVKRSLIKNEANSNTEMQLEGRATSRLQPPTFKPTAVEAKSDFEKESIVMPAAHSKRLRRTSAAFLEFDSRRDNSGEAGRRSDLFDQIKEDAESVTHRETPRTMAERSNGDGYLEFRESKMRDFLRDGAEARQQSKANDDSSSPYNRSKPQSQEPFCGLDQMEVHESSFRQRRQASDVRKVVELSSKDPAESFNELSDGEADVDYLERQRVTRRLPPAPSFRTTVRNSKNSFRDSLNKSNVKPRLMDFNEEKQKKSPGIYPGDDVAENKFSPRYNTGRDVRGKSISPRRRPTDSLTDGAFPRANQILKREEHEYQHFEEEEIQSAPPTGTNFYQLSRTGRLERSTIPVAGGIKRTVQQEEALHNIKSTSGAKGQDDLAYRGNTRVPAGHFRNTEEQIEEKWTAAYHQEQEPAKDFFSNADAVAERRNDRRRPLIDPVKFFQLGCEEESNDVDQQLQDTTVYSWRSNDDTLDLSTGKGSEKQKQMTPNSLRYGTILHQAETSMRGPHIPSALPQQTKPLTRNAPATQSNLASRVIGSSTPPRMPTPAGRVPLQPYTATMGEQDMHSHPHSTTEEDSAKSSCPSSYRHQHQKLSSSASTNPEKSEKEQDQSPAIRPGPVDAPPGKFYPRTGRHPSTRFADDFRNIATAATNQDADQVDIDGKPEPPSADFLSFARNHGSSRQHMITRPLRGKTTSAYHANADYPDDGMPDADMKRDLAGGRNALCKFLLSGPSDEEDEEEACQQQGHSPAMMATGAPSAKRGPRSAHIGHQVPGSQVPTRTLEEPRMPTSPFSPAQQQQQQPRRPRTVEGRRVNGIGSWRSYVRGNQQQDPYEPLETEDEPLKNVTSISDNKDSLHQNQMRPLIRADPILVQQRAYYSSPSANITYVGPNRRQQADEKIQPPSGRPSPITRSMPLRGGSRWNSTAPVPNSSGGSSLLASFPGIDPYSLLAREDGGDSKVAADNASNLLDDDHGASPLLANSFASRNKNHQRACDQQLNNNRTRLPTMASAFDNASMDEAHGDGFRLTQQESRNKAQNSLTAEHRGTRNRQQHDINRSPDSAGYPEATVKEGKYLDVDIEAQRAMNSRTTELMKSSGDKDEAKKNEKPTLSNNKGGSSSAYCEDDKDTSHSAKGKTGAGWLSLFGLDNGSSKDSTGESKQKSKKPLSKFGRAEASAGGIGCSMTRENGWSCFNPMYFLSSMFSMRSGFPGPMG